VLEGQPKLPTSALQNKLENKVEASDEVELDLTLTALEKTNDLLRINVNLKEQTGQVLRTRLRARRRS
jgi:hypothetical protein